MPTIESTLTSQAGGEGLNCPEREEIPPSLQLLHRAVKYALQSIFPITRTATEEGQPIVLRLPERWNDENLILQQAESAEPPVKDALNAAAEYIRKINTPPIPGPSEQRGVVDPLEDIQRQSQFPLRLVQIREVLGLLVPEPLPSLEGVYPPSFWSPRGKRDMVFGEVEFLGNIPDTRRGKDGKDTARLVYSTLVRCMLVEYASELIREGVVNPHGLIPEAIRTFENWREEGCPPNASLVEEDRRISPRARSVIRAISILLNLRLPSEIFSLARQDRVSSAGIVDEVNGKKASEIYFLLTHFLTLVAAGKFNNAYPPLTFIMLVLDNDNYIELSISDIWPLTDIGELPFAMELFKVLGKIDQIKRIVPLYPTGLLTTTDELGTSQLRRIGEDFLEQILRRIFGPESRTCDMSNEEMERWVDDNIRYNLQRFYRGDGDNIQRFLASPIGDRFVGDLMEMIIGGLRTTPFSLHRGSLRVPPERRSPYMHFYLRTP